MNWLGVLIMGTMTGGQALVQTLKREGVEVIFGLPGVQMDWAFDALWEERENIKIIHTRNEQATSYMADGYARSTGKIGVCMMVPGPGLLNAMAGLSTALGTPGQQINEPDEFIASFANSLKSSGPSLLEVMVETGPGN